MVVFTTILMEPLNATDKQKESREKYDIGAGRKLRDEARKIGLNAVEDLLWVNVQGMKGPRVETGVEKTNHFTHDLLVSLQA